MAIGETAHLSSVREQLLAGRERLSAVLGHNQGAEVLRLLDEVDSALQRIDRGSFGLCEACHDTIEAERLSENPLARVCLGCLTPQQQRALEYDLELAGQIQKGLLPPCDINLAGWDVCYHYQPAGVVSGDYCDLIVDRSGELYFVLADVSGKGVAAAMLGSNLRAVFRSLVPLRLPMGEMVARANRLFRQSALPTQYATLICGRATMAGELEIVNAGHLPAMLGSASGISLLESTDPPLGVFDEQKFTAVSRKLEPGATLVVYTDGISEAENEGGDEYGVERLSHLIDAHCAGCPEKLIDICKEQVRNFRGGRERFDDETMLALQYKPAAMS